MTLLFRLCLLLLLLPCTVLAELPAGVKADFAPEEGYVIMPLGDEFLVDLGTSANLTEGDILTIITPGDKIIHPVSKEVIGTLELPSGYLQVSRVKSDYSYARLLSPDTPPEKGAKIKRFEQVPTAFANQAEYPELYQQLRQDLPQLNWLATDSGQPPLLVFSASEGTLSVTSSSGATLHNYQLRDGQIIAPQTQIPAGQTFGPAPSQANDKGILAKAVDSVAGKIGLGDADDGMAGRFGVIRAPQTTQTTNTGLWSSQPLAGEPVGLSVADLDSDGQLEILTATQHQLLIHQVNQGQLQQEAEINLSRRERILSIDTLQQPGSATPDIYLTVINEEQLVSKLIRYSDGKYRTVIDKFPWFLRVVELPREGRRLVGQQTDGKSLPFSGRVYRFWRSGTQLTRGEALPLQENSDFYAFNYLATDSSGQLLASFTPDDYLRIYTLANKQLWESDDYLGGSETRLFETEMNHGETFQPVYLHKRMLTGPENELLVVENKGSRALSGLRLFDNSRIMALAWNGMMMQEVWRTADLNGYLADYALADADNDGVDELVFQLKQQHRGLFKKPEWSILIYELN